MFSEYLSLQKEEESEPQWDERLPHEIEVESNLSAELDDNTLSIVKKDDIVDGKDIFLLESLLSAEECKRIIAATEKYGYGRTDFLKHYRGNTRLKCRDDALANALFGRLSTFLPSTLKEYHGEDLEFELIGINSTFRFSKYSPGDLFKPHVDTYYQQERPDNHVEKSMYTLNLYLNDDFSAGNTRFFKSRSDPTVEASIEPASGTCLLFRQPPDSHFFHDGDLVSDGYKYLLRSDIIYRSTNPSTIFTYVPPTTPSKSRFLSVILSILCFCSHIFEVLLDFAKKCFLATTNKEKGN